MRLLLVAALCGLSLPAQRPEALLERMTLDEKAGQLFVSWILSGADDAARDQIKGWIRDVGLGGVVLSKGNVQQAAKLIAELQSSSRVPLIVAGDFEAGLAFRLRGATDMGNQMLVGATGLSRLAYAMGQVTGAEARALGFHWCYAPVLDVNVNPQNPIINVRAFGQDPRLVARMGTAFLCGVQEHNVLATGKHFPGHGDVATDSHHEMPTVPGDRKRLEAVELLPFRAAVQAGLLSIMTGHLAVPGLGEDPAVPATLSRRILGGVLRADLKFKGLIVTDALDMGGVRKKFDPNEVAVRALLAGADVLLMPPDPAAAQAAIVAAVRKGRVPVARLDEAVRRILRAKERLGLLAGKGRVNRRWHEVVAAPAHLAVADEIAHRGITLVRDDRGRVPLKPGNHVVVSLVGKRQKSTTTFRAALARHLGTVEELRVHRGSSPNEIRTAAKAVAAGAVVVSFGSPYRIRQFPKAGAYLCAYTPTPHTEAAVAAALAGKAPLTGRLPVTIPSFAEAGSGLDFLPGRRLTQASPETEGLDPKLPGAIRRLLDQSIADGAFPGAVCMVARRGTVVAEVACGQATYAQDSPRVTLDSLFDLASLTKVATTSAVLRLVAAGKLSLDTRVQSLLPGFTGPGKERVCVRHLLAHAAGLPAHRRYHRTLTGKDAILKAALVEDLTAQPGHRAVYSDVGFMVLMAYVEAATKERFETIVTREVLVPLGMSSACFNTGRDPLPAQPTEKDPDRGGVVQGFVHDENAYAMGGVSGHAGLFATARDVLRLGVAYLGGGRGWLPPRLARQATRPAGLVRGSSRGLGWDTLAAGGWGGTTLPKGAFGHTGFTGTSVWCEPRSDLCVVLLTNRVHPSRANRKITGVRRALHDLVLAAVER